MSKLSRVSRFISDLSDRGPLFAIANDRIHSPSPLDPEENWHFWTRPHPLWLEWCAKSYPPETKRRAYIDHLLKRDHADGIEAHYDVSNEFYALFLDQKYRFYTCAEFVSDRNSLEDAQTHKAEYLRSLLQLTGHEKILDLGCGWSAMLKFLQDQGHEGELTGFTLSKEQLAYGSEQLGFNIMLKNFVTEPFEENAYDRIFSIGALEHVRPSELSDLYQKIYEALVPGGFSVHQFFSLDHEAYPCSMVAAQLFFPGSLLVMHDQHIAAAQQAGFEVIHDSIHDYRPTLRAWYERLVSNQEKALKLVGLETYNRYMTFFPFAWLFFHMGESKLHRIVLRKSSDHSSISTI